MSTISEQIFNRIFLKLQESKNLDEPTIDELFSLFGNQCKKILALLDPESMTRIDCPSRRNIFRVSNPLRENLEYNYCLTLGNFCTCAKFKKIVSRDNQQLWCYHLAAAKLAEALECHRIERYGQNAFDKLLMTIIL